jgi:hypothetical protein
VRESAVPEPAAGPDSEVPEGAAQEPVVQEPVVSEPVALEQAAALAVPESAVPGSEVPELEVPEPEVLGLELVAAQPRGLVARITVVGSLLSRVPTARIPNWARPPRVRSGSLSRSRGLASPTGHRCSPSTNTRRSSARRW